MKYSTTCKTFARALLSTLAVFTYATAADSTEPQPLPPNLPSQVRYKLINLGESDVASHLLSISNNKEPSLAPVINNKGQIIGNRIEGGFLRDPVQGEWAPHLHNEIAIHFHDINDKGDILVSINRKINHPEWMIWPTAMGDNGARQRLDIDDHQEQGKLFFVGINEDRVAVGNLYRNERSLPIFWKPQEELSFVTDTAGQKLEGEFRGINAHDQMVGFLQQQKDRPPTVWSQNEGLKTLRNFRPKISATAEAKLADIALSNDGTVYGTYAVHDTRSKAPAEYYTYAWLPYGDGDFKLLDLDGMRIADLNDNHVLAGEFAGQAAVCEPGERPLQLCKAIKPEEMKGWELIEATSINNAGDIVGYGLYHDKMHIFKAERVRPIVYSVEEENK